MYGSGRIFDGECPFLEGTRGVEQFQRSVIEEIHRLEIISMTLVGHAQRGQSPSIFSVRIESDVVGFER